MAMIKSTQVSALINLGADAMDNLFDVNIQLPLALSSDEEVTQKLEDSLTLRCLGFTPPKFTAKTYDMSYKTSRLKKAAGKIEGERIFKLQFRLDAYYSIYRLLLNWRKICLQPSTEYAASTISNVDENGRSYLGIISVSALDTPVSRTTFQDEAIGVTKDIITEKTLSSSLSWKFKDVWVQNVDDPVFKAGNADIQIISATFGFCNFEDPQYLDYSNSKAV